MPVVEVNGIDLVYERYPASTGVRGAPVVLVCGTGQPASSWSMFGTVEGLMAAGHEVITFDNRGVAPSACPAPPWSTDDMAEDVIGVISQLCDRPVHLLGASLGANIVHAVAMRRPDLVRTAIMTVGGTQFCAGYQPLARGLLEIIEHTGRIPAALDLYTMILAMLPPAARSDPAQIAAVDALAEMFTVAFGPGGQHGQMAANVGWMDGGDARITELAGMQVPCLMTANEHDPFFAPADMKRAAATIPDCQLEVIPGVSHVVLDPDWAARTNAITIEFLSMHEQTVDK